MNPNEKTLWLWCKREFNEKYADRAAQDLIEVLNGCREGNRFEREAIRRVLGITLPAKPR